MSTISLNAMIPTMAPYVPGCPDLTLTQTIRLVIMDLCQRAKVWRDIVTISTVPGQSTYVPVSPVAHGEVTDFLTGKLTQDGLTNDVYWRAYDLVTRLYPSWPQASPGRPRVITARLPNNWMMAPVPDTAGSLEVLAVLRPTQTADVWESELWAEFNQAIFHGVLHRTMMMPDRSWTDMQTGAFHGKQWTHFLNEARDRAQRDYNVANLGVQMRPFA